MRAEDNKRFVYFLVALNILPHSVELPDWIIVSGLLFVLWKYASEYFQIPVPNRLLISIFGIAGGAGVYVEYGTIMGDEASASILVLAVSLKLFEVKKYRDIMIVTILCYFLLMSKLISSQTIAMTIFMLVDLVLITSLLALHHSPVDQGNGRALIRRSFRLALLSSPIVASMFFIFPRFNMGIGNNTQRSLAQMGFSDRLNPGSISELMQSDQLIFRARFPNKDSLSSNQLYWRGAVLAFVDGLQWRRGEAYSEYSKYEHDHSIDESVIVTDIYMEPQAEKNMFALDWPTFLKFPEDRRNYRVKVFPFKVFEATTPFMKREYYSVYSNVHPKKVKWDSHSEDLFLQVANKPSEKVNILLQELKMDEETTASMAIMRIYSYYRKNHFVYSLKNPPMQSVDDFLFTAKSGFCEHYAGVTAYLLRLMGIPSRVVVGFQGGKPSFLGDYLSIRALDAHAWLEYFDRQQSLWVRIDPTVAVAPMRIAGGAEELLNNLGEDSTSRMGLDWLQKIIGKDSMKNYFAMQKIFDQVDASWSNFLLKYNFEYQKELLSGLGLRGGARWLLGGLTALFLVMFLGILLILFSRQRSKGDRVSEVYWKLLKKIHKAGVSKYSWEGPADFGNRVLREFPESKEKLEPLFVEILNLRYSKGKVTGRELGVLKGKVNQLKIKGKPRNVDPESHREEKLL